MNTFAPMFGKYTLQATQSSPEGTVISVKHQFKGPLDRTAAEEKLRGIFRDFAPKAMTDHVILGHFKGSIQSGEAFFAISVTREDVPDETADERWKSLSFLPEGEVTVNLLTVLPVAVTEQDLAQAVALQF